MSSGIRLIVGLGNVGPEYEDTRHNAGFWFVDELARAAGARFNRESRFHGEVARIGQGSRQAWLLKPGTFMNRSGMAVQALAAFYRIAPEEILVAHDELDLLPGQTKVKRGGGNAGHNGLKDIQARLGTGDYWRLRLGIGHPRTLQLSQEVIDFVLHRPSREQRAAIDEEIARAAQPIDLALDGQLEAYTLRVHTRPRA